MRLRIFSTHLTLVVFFSIASSRLGSHLEATTPKRALDLLSRECLTCHNEDKRKGGLSLHSQTSLRDGGDYGPVIKKEDPLSSPLLEVLTPGADPHMPPKSQLSSEEIRLLRQWVEKGAAWDRPVLKEPDYDWQDIKESPAQFSQIKALTFDLSPDEGLLAVGNEGVIKILRYGKQTVLKIYIMCLHNLLGLMGAKWLHFMSVTTNGIKVKKLLYLIWGKMTTFE